MLTEIERGREIWEDFIWQTAKKIVVMCPYLDQNEVAVKLWRWIFEDGGLEELEYYYAELGFEWDEDLIYNYFLEALYNSNWRKAKEINEPEEKSGRRAGFRPVWSNARSRYELDTTND